MFRDGRPVQASDIVFTYQCLLAPSYDGPLKGRLQGIRSVKAVNSSQVVFQLADWVKVPDYAWFCVGILQADYYQVGLDQVYLMRDRNQLPEGSGSFACQTMTGDHLQLQLRPGYAGNIKRIEIRQVASDQKFALLQAGELDIVRNNWDARMQERANRLPAYAITPYQAIDTYFCVSRQPGPAQVLHKADQQSAVLHAVAGWTLSAADMATLQGLQNQPLVMPIFQGIDAATEIQLREEAEKLVTPLNQFGITVSLLAVDWPTLAELATTGHYDLLLLPVPANQRLPDQALLLDSPATSGQSSLANTWPAIYKPKVLMISRRLEQVTINAQGLALAANAAREYPFIQSRFSWLKQSSAG
jgi:ABC-type transport system substrate-binding protein